MQKNIILRFVVVALMLYALVSLASVRLDLRRTEQLAAALQEQQAQLAAENRSLTEKLSKARDPEEMRRLAWSRLGLVQPGDKLFYFVQAENEKQG